MEKLSFLCRRRFPPTLNVRILKLWNPAFCVVSFYVRLITRQFPKDGGRRLQNQDHGVRRLCGFRFLVLLFVFLTVSTFSKISLAQNNLGTPVREAICWGVFVGPGKTGAMDTIYLSFGQYEAPLFLFAVNPDTGQPRQFNGPLSSEMGSWGFAIDHENRIYLGSYYSAHLLRFDPATEKWEDLGQPAGESESFICKIT